MRLGVEFLHWRCRRQASVFILDGEMPLSLVKERLAVAASWFGANSEDITDSFQCLSREDVPDMPPLDTPDGACWLRTS